MWQVASQILRYLKTTLEKGLLLRKIDQRGVECYANVDWSGLIEEKKSTIGYCTKVWESGDLEKQETDNGCKK